MGTEPIKQVLITSKLGMYVWYPALMSVDFIQPGKQTPVTTLHIKIKKNNTQIGALTVAVRHMSDELKRRNLKEEG